MDIVRVLRIIEYVGPREAVEEVVAHSLHGQRSYPRGTGKVTIRAATLGTYPEVLTSISEQTSAAAASDSEASGTKET